VGRLFKVLLAFVSLTTMCRTTKLGIAGGPLHFCSLGATFIYFCFCLFVCSIGLSAKVFSTTICQFVNLRICQRLKPESTNDHSSVWALWSLQLPQQLHEHRTWYFVISKFPILVFKNQLLFTLQNVNFFTLCFFEDIYVFV
jgi:hypothetical protein